ncbi:hypothetical protein EV715DRAFT_250925 [Schizophyllum commune]
MEFMQSLRIPCLPDTNPSLLLHELGCESHPAAAASRLSSIFCPGQHTAFVNSSSTGKTRLLYEGLCKNWGLYVSCNGKPPRLSSGDILAGIQLADLQELNGVDATDSARAQISETNAEQMHDLSIRVLLCRLTIFKLYLASLPNARDLEYRKRWLLLQIAPRHMVREDVFDGLASRLNIRHTTPGYVQRLIEDTLDEIRSSIGMNEPFFFVVDDAHAISDQFSEAFGSSTCLRELTRPWEGYDGLTMVLSGVPFDMAPFRDASYSLCVDTGSFSDVEDQRRYIRRYLPPRLCESEDGQKLINRICLWFRGRYRLTALFLTSLLMGRLLFPHTLLSAFIAVNARVEPDDSPLTRDGLVCAGHERLVHGLGVYDPVTYLNNDIEAWFTAHMVLHRMIVFGEEGFRSTKDCLHLVTCCLGAFNNAEGSEVVVDEPMYIFPLADIFFRAGIGSAYGFLAKTASSVLLSPPLHNSIHLSFLTLLLLALKGNRRLSDLFLTNDLDTLPCAYKSCKLVRVTREESDGRLRATPFITGFPETECDERWATESPDWLQHAAPEPFCAAKLFSHADLLFVVQLADGSLLPVALKIILKNAQIQVSMAEVEEHLARLTYERIFEKVDHLDVRQSIFASSTPGAGDDSVVRPMLRALATYPDATYIDRRPDNSSQPIAALNVSLMRWIAADIPYDSVLNRLYAALMLPRKQRLVGDGSLQVEESVESYRARVPYTHKS